MEKSRAAVEMLLKDERVDLSIRCGGHDLEDMIDRNSDLKNLVQFVKEALNNRISAKKDSIPKIMEREIQRELSNDLSELLDSGSFSDFKIVCGGETFACHKNILATRSTYMEAMLNSGMKEVDEGVMEIKDLDVDDVRAVLKFIYTGRVKNIKKNSTALLRAADRYELLGLKKLCEKELISSMKTDNVLDRLILADSAQASNLRDAAKKWILKYHAEVLKQKDWKEKITTCGGVIYEIFESLSCQRSAKRKRTKENRDARRQRHRHHHFSHDHDEHNHYQQHNHHHHEHEHEHEQNEEHDNNPQQENESASEDESDDGDIHAHVHWNHHHQQGHGLHNHGHNHGHGIQDHGQFGHGHGHNHGPQNPHQQN